MSEAFVRKKVDVYFRACLQAPGPVQAAKDKKTKRHYKEIADGFMKMCNLIGITGHVYLSHNSVLMLQVMK
jgi:hypothetical protein